jgi:electron transfer flavoprotein alpha subunit
MGDILIIGEHKNGELRGVTREAVGAAASIKAALGGRLFVALLSDQTTELTTQANLAGVDEIRTIALESPHFDSAIYEHVACSIGAELRPYLILFGHTADGMACAPAIAARLGSGFASDVFGLHVEDKSLVVTRGAYGNKLNVELAFNNKGVVVLTLRGGVFKPVVAPGTAEIVAATIDISKVAAQSVHIDYADPPASGVDVAAADFILSVGRGIQDEKNLSGFAALASRVGATFGCSRPIVDSGWLPKSHQIGQSGKVAVSCKLYLALGISGAIQHLYGMKHVDTIIAVNTDANAPIFNVATYGICLDLFTFADALKKQFDSSADTGAVQPDFQGDQT